MFVIRNLKIRHYNVVRSVGPTILDWLVNTVCFAWKVKSLQTKLTILLEKWSPLYWSNRPVEYVLINKVVVGVIILSPLYYWMSGPYFHLFAGILILISLIMSKPYIVPLNKIYLLKGWSKDTKVCNNDWNHQYNS